MNPPADSENPLLTRYVLDDLPVAERQAVESWIQENPAMSEEVRHLQEVAESLRAEAPMHDLRLTHTQRARVLQPPRRKPVAAPLRRMRHAAPLSLFGALPRLAAMIALLAGAFWLGRQYEPGYSGLAQTGPVSEDAENPAAPATVAVANPEVEPLDAAPAASPSAEESAPAPLLATASQTAAANAAVQDEAAPVAAPGVPAPDEPAAMVVADMSPEEIKAPGAAKIAAGYGITATGAAADFINASRKAGDQILLQPRLMRPASAADARQLQAKPLAPDAAGKTQAAPRRKPDLHIHSWSAETASCPWNPRHRLLRVTIQLPADQEAVALGSHDYPVEAQFDANNVREFRRLATRYLPPAEVRSAGAQTIWYEFQPNGSPASAHENGKLIATISLPGAKFTTQAVGPFDASRLQVLDRGRDWQDAREDFLFETAVVGLGLLLDGSAQDSTLNHQLVLDLALAAKEAGDPDGARARFIGALRQLGRLAGR